MSKRKYRSTKVKSLDWSKLGEEVAGERVVFAIDAAKEVVYGTLMKASKDVIVTIRWTHPLETAQVIRQLCESVSSDALDMVIEPSGSYSDPLVWGFEHAGIAVYRVSPKKTYDAKELYDGVPSLHDAKSAYVIGRLHLDGHSQRWQPDSDQRRELNVLLGLLETYRSSYQRNLNRLEGKLARHWPEVLGVLALNSVTLEALVVTYGEPRALAEDAAGASVLMGQVSRSGLSQTKQAAVLAGVRDTLGVPCITAERTALQALAVELRRLRQLVNQAQRLVERASQETPDIACLSAAVGKLTAVVLVAKLGSPTAYDSANSYVKAMGLNLKEKSSGTYKGQLKITKRGASLVRMYLYFAAMRLIKTDAVVRAWYQRKVCRDGGRVKMKALVAVMRKLAKALWHVGQGAVFDSSRLFNRAELGLDTASQTQKAA